MIKDNLNNDDKDNKLMNQKMEKLSTAIYLVTQFISDEDPIKFSIRRLSLRLLEEINNSKTESVIIVVQDIISLLSISKNTNLISSMNADLVIISLEKLNDILSKRHFILDKSLLDISEEKLFPLNILDKRQRNSLASINNPFGQIIKDNSLLSVNSNLLKPQNTTLINSKRQMKKSILIQERKDGRREQILNMFIKGAEYSIKDIARKIPGCSEKTVVRELENLIQENKVERIGERRWAKYFLS